MSGLEQELARRGTELLRRRLSGFDPDLLAALALVPEWTQELAGSVSLLSGDDLDRLEDVGLIERRRVLASSGGRQEAFWLRAAVRPEAARLVRSRLSATCDLLEANLPPLTPTIQAWLRAAALRAEPTGLELVEAVDRMINDGDLAGASRLVTAAEVLGQTLGGPLADAARRAGWRVDRLARAADDLEQLRHYLHRGEAEEALTELITGEAEPWALHLLGGGGTGKTMLVRYLASGRFAEDRGIAPFPVARADFDHLDPRYPEQRPGELLHALAGELLGYGADRHASQSFRAFEDSSVALTEELARTGPSPSRVEQLLRAMVSAFAGFVGALPSPAVLVLDTCEELAKLYPPGSTAPGIEHTFRLLELMHAELPQLKVVLAGRRWLVPPPSELTVGPVLTSRPYVRVLKLGGFALPEAELYLDRRAPGIPAPLREAVLERARQQDSYNPFELAAYAHWAAAEPGMDAAALLGAPGDPYVERRIVGRVSAAAVRAALPVAAELGRFDLDLLRPALTRAGIDPMAAFDELATHDWINVVSLGPDGRAGVVEVDEHLRDRLRSALPLSDPGALGRDAAAVIASTPLPDLPVETVEAAVRLLPPAEAAMLWASLERRVLDGGHWGWAVQVSARVGAGEEGRQGESILAAILATQAAAATRAGRPAARLWEAVAAHAGRHPDPVARETLALRAALWDQDPRQAIRDAMEREGRPGIGSVAAILHRRPVAVPGLEALWENPGPFNAAAAIILASQAVTADTPEAATRHADRALGLAALDPGPPLPDWEPPAGLLDHCRAARLAVATRWGEPLDAVPWESWREECLARADGPEPQLVLAFGVAFALGHRAVDADTLTTLEAVATPGPLAAELATAWAVAGDPGRGQALLARCLAEAAGSDLPPDLVEECRIALIRLATRCLTAAWVPDLVHIERTGTSAEREAAGLLTLALGNAPLEVDPPPEAEPPSWTAVARSSAAVTGAPGTRGRALLLEALTCVRTSRDRALPLLSQAAALLREAQDADGADMARVLGLLCRVLTGSADARETTSLAPPDQLMNGVRAVPGSRWPALLKATADVLAARSDTAARRAASLALGSSQEQGLTATPRARSGGSSRIGAGPAAAVLYLGSAAAAAYGLATLIAALPVGPPLSVVFAATLGVAVLTGAAAVAFGALGSDSLNGMAGAAWGAGVGLSCLAAAVPEGPLRIAAFCVAMLPPVVAVAIIARVRALVRRHPAYYTLRVRPEGIRLYERGSAATLNGGLGPLVQRFDSVYRQTWEQEDPDAPPALGSVFPPGGGPVAVSLDIGEEFRNRPWEQLVTAGFAPAVRPRLVIFHRDGEGRAKRRHWRTSRREAYLGPPHLAEGREPPRERGTYRMIHAIGRPLDTAAGPQLRVMDEAAKAKGQRVREGERLVRLELQQALGLVILQADPAERARPLAESREAFLDVADIVFFGKPKSVLVIPALPDDVALDAVATLRREYLARGRQPYPTELIDLVLQLKGRLPPEVAPDVMLFMKVM
ncbi:hypothetical protein [Nonomuraea sediminis]|uniref:hypothetical protein n=1 Tax=Nonomuraea sediminis TaxID=2835864 RepID=UPI001BDBBD59|nr:hypothetical protein [Nonomuraea sediminis]